MPAIMFPVTELIALCKSRGAMVLIDGAHALGQVALNFDTLGADFYAGTKYQIQCQVKCQSNITDTQQTGCTDTQQTGCEIRCSGTIILAPPVPHTTPAVISVVVYISSNNVHLLI